MEPKPERKHMDNLEEITNTQPALGVLGTMNPRDQTKVRLYISCHFNWKYVTLQNENMFNFLLFMLICVCIRISKP